MSLCIQPKTKPRGNPDFAKQRVVRWRSTKSGEAKRQSRRSPPAAAARGGNLAGAAAATHGKSWHNQPLQLLRSHRASVKLQVASVVPVGMGQVRLAVRPVVETSNFCPKRDRTKDVAQMGNWSGTETTPPVAIRARSMQQISGPPRISKTTPVILPHGVAIIASVRHVLSQPVR